MRLLSAINWCAYDLLCASTTGEKPLIPDQRDAAGIVKYRKRIVLISFLEEFGKTTHTRPPTIERHFLFAAPTCPIWWGAHPRF
nr:unnamed protein product [Callosobruchus chinensis]